MSERFPLYYKDNIIGHCTKDNEKGTIEFHIHVPIDKIVKLRDISIGFKEDLE